VATILSVMVNSLLKIFVHIDVFSIDCIELLLTAKLDLIVLVR
jgi:hypothetical protein